MKLTIVGCAGSYPGPDSAASCYLVEAEQDGRVWRLVLDMGNGSLGQLHRYIDPRGIDAVALSHLHPDHCIDLVSLVVLAKYHPQGPYDRVKVIAPRGGEEYLAAAGGPGGEPPLDALTFGVWEDEPEQQLGPFSIRVAPVKHPVPAFAMRIQAGDSVLVYSGDTGPTEALDELAADADVFLCEASFVESAVNPPDLHLTGKEAGECALKADVGRLLITHIPDWTDADEVESDLRAVYDRAYVMVKPGDSFEF
ncbi:MAG: MBL fold metallo-hydrolase [Aeromicrobium sp.]|uniref:MBL fold metallo-hydrolase n=1 Tax=Aeromicrobium sp. TaxID=1871063 RepID=UPI0039E23DF3